MVRNPEDRFSHDMAHYILEAEGETPSNLVVLCGGRIFNFNVIGPDGEILTPPEIHKQLAHIKSVCDKEGPGPGVGALTGDNRTSWAEVKQIWAGS